jgi:acyl carrier protein
MKQFVKGDANGMDRSQISDELLSILKKFMPKAPNASAITDSTTLSQELNIDSADLIEIVLAIEEQFSITVADEHLNRIKTFGDLLSLVTELTAK